MTERNTGTKASPNEGEGSQTGARQYNDATKAFVEEGKVGPAAAEAEKAVSGPERAALEKAEREGRAHSHGEDPAIKRG